MIALLPSSDGICCHFLTYLHKTFSAFSLMACVSIMTSVLSSIGNSVSQFDSYTCALKNCISFLSEISDSFTVFLFFIHSSFGGVGMID